jgi:hypothetical protein
VAPIPSSSKGKVGDASGTDDGELTTMPSGPFNPEMKELLIAAPVVALYSPIVSLPEFVTKRFPPDNAMPDGKLNPEEMKELLIVAPVVALYWPIVLLLLFVTKIWARPVTGVRQSAATTGARRSEARARESGPELDLVFVFIGLNLKILNEGLVFMGLVLCGVFYRNSQSSLPVRVALAGV